MLTAMSVGTANLINIARMSEPAYQATTSASLLPSDAITRGR
jgi:hypothetical protein